jgi:hypothetical protein
VGEGCKEDFTTEDTEGTEGSDWKFRIADCGPSGFTLTTKSTLLVDCKWKAVAKELGID